MGLVLFLLSWPVLISVLGLTGLAMRRWFRALSARITFLIMALGPSLLIALFGLFLAIRSVKELNSGRLTLVVELIMFGALGSVLLGIMASRLVNRPLRQFTAAIASARDNEYATPLPNSSIREFDEVFVEFSELRARLRREEELRRDLISDTSHELNTPLTAMLGQLTAMSDGVLPADPARIRLLRDQAERLADLVGQLEEYARARAMVGPGTRTDVPLAELHAELRELYGDERITLVLDAPPGHPIRADRAVLRRILTNLVRNAFRHSGGSTVTIEARADHLAVRDDGRGVPAESLPLLFERFYRVDASRSRDTGGLGLGLAIVRELAEHEGWRIEAVDNDPGLAVVLRYGSVAREGENR